MERDCITCRTRKCPMVGSEMCNEGNGYAQWSGNQPPAEVDTKAIRERGRAYCGTEGIEIIDQLCDEVVCLRYKLDAVNRICKVAQEHIKQVHAENARLKEEITEKVAAAVKYQALLVEEKDALIAELASLREKAGEKVCEKCGGPGGLYDVNLTFSCEDGGQNELFYHRCRACLDRALTALRGQEK